MAHARPSLLAALALALSGFFGVGPTQAQSDILPRVTLQATAGTEAEGNALEVTVRIDYANDATDGQEVVLGLTFLPGSSTATEADFTQVPPTTFVFSGDVTGEEQSVSIALTENDGIEATETAVFEVGVLSGEATVWGFNQFTATILDTDLLGPAQVQVIHNAADPAAAVVDIALTPLSGGGAVALDGVAFRSATGFSEVMAGTYLVTVTPDGGSDPIIEHEVAILANGIYQLIASGVGNPAAFEDNPDGVDTAAGLIVNAAAQTASVDDFNVALNVVHGVTDAPMVDVRDRASGDVLVNDAEYSDLRGYLEIAPFAYVLRLTDEIDADEFARYAVDLGGLEGEVVTVLASGFLTPENDQDGPAFGLLAVLADGTSFLLPQLFSVSIGDARDLPLGTLVEVEGIVTRTLGDFTRMQDATGGLTVRQTSGAFNEDVADGTITSGTVLGVTGITSEFNGLFQINNEDLSDYAVLGTAPVPMPQAVTLAEIAAHGEAYESELVEVSDLTIEGEGDETFDPATTYAIADPTQDDGTVSLRVPNADDTRVDDVTIPSAAFTFAGVLGQFSPSDPAAGYQILPVLETDIVPAPELFAAVQVIHNAPDPGLAEVDVFVDGALSLPDLAFRTATEFLMLPAGVEIEIGVAPGDADGADDAFFTATYTLDEGVAYQLIASGVETPGDFAANPDGIATAFTLLVNAGAQTDGTGGFFLVDANGVHGVPDAPAVDIVEASTSALLVDDVSYTEVSPYVAVPVGNYALSVTPADDNTTVLATFAANLTGFGGDALTVLASGFLTPEANQSGPGLGILLVETDGTTTLLEPLATSSEDGAGLPSEFTLQGAYPNPFATAATIRYDLPADAQVSLVVYDVLGREVVRTRTRATQAGAGHTLALDGRDLRSGAYLYRLTAEMADRTATASGSITVVR